MNRWVRAWPVGSWLVYNGLFFFFLPNTYNHLTFNLIFGLSWAYRPNSYRPLAGVSHGVGSDFFFFIFYCIEPEWSRPLWGYLPCTHAFILNFFNQNCVQDIENNNENAVLKYLCYYIPLWIFALYAGLYYYFFNQNGVQDIENKNENSILKYLC